MLRSLVVLAFVVLAGCSSSRPTPAPLLSTTTPSQAVLTFAPTLRTDTLHLLDPPHMAGKLGPRDGPARSTVPSDYDPLQGGLAWSMERPRLTLLSAHVVFWVDVEGVVTNTQSGGCFWSPYLLLVSDDQTTQSSSLDCLPEPTVVPAGIRPIEANITFDTLGVPGDLLAVGLNAQYVPGSGTISVLSGTPETDSRITIRDLQVPLDTETLL